MFRIYDLELRILRGVVGSLYFFGDDFNTGGDGLCVLGIIHADTSPLHLPQHTVVASVPCGAIDTGNLTVVREV